MRCRLSLLPECVCCSRRSQVPLWNINLHILSYHNKEVPCTPIENGRDFVCLGKLWNMGLLFKKPLPAVRGSCWAFFSLSFAFFMANHKLLSNELSFFHWSHRTKQLLYSIRSHPRLRLEANRIFFRAVSTVNRIWAVQTLATNPQPPPPSRFTSGKRYAW